MRGQLVLVPALGSSLSPPSLGITLSGALKPPPTAILAGLHSPASSSSSLCLAGVCNQLLLTSLPFPPLHWGIIHSGTSTPVHPIPHSVRPFPLHSLSLFGLCSPYLL